MNALAELLGHEGSMGAFVLVEAGQPGRDADRVYETTAGAAPGTTLAYALPIDGPVWRRAARVMFVRGRIRRVARAFARGGAPVVGAFGVEPSLEAAALLFELGTPAEQYADRCCRPAGRARWLRRGIAAVGGIDPAMGAVVVVARKP